MRRVKLCGRQLADQCVGYGLVQSLARSPNRRRFSGKKKFIGSLSTYHINSEFATMANFPSSFFAYRLLVKFDHYAKGDNGCHYPDKGIKPFTVSSGENRIHKYFGKQWLDDTDDG